ncbi:MAG: hypothetical protein ACYCSG_03110 [Thermoplasmataceae archaeon]
MSGGNSLYKVSLKSACCDDLLTCLFMLGQTDILLFNCMAFNNEYTLDGLAQLSGKDKTTVFRSLQKMVSIGIVIKNTKTIARGGYYHTYYLSDMENIKKISLERINATHDGFLQLLDQLLKDISMRIKPVENLSN